MESKGCFYNIYIGTEINILKEYGKKLIKLKV